MNRTGPVAAGCAESGIYTAMHFILVVIIVAAAVAGLGITGEDEKKRARAEATKTEAALKTPAKTLVKAPVKSEVRTAAPESKRARIASPAAGLSPAPAPLPENVSLLDREARRNGLFADALVAAQARRAAPGPGMTREEILKALRAGASWRGLFRQLKQRDLISESNLGLVILHYRGDEHTSRPSTASDAKGEGTADDGAMNDGDGNAGGKNSELSAPQVNPSAGGREIAAMPSDADVIAPISNTPQAEEIPAEEIIAVPARNQVAPPAMLAPSGPVPVPAHGYDVQIGAFRSAEGAAQGVRILARKLETALQGRAPRTIRVDLGSEKGVYFRLLVGPVADAAKAGDLCRAIVASGGACLVRRVSVEPDGDTG